MKIRKQASELTLEDVTAFPVWKFALDEESEEGQDEATVRPCKVSGAVDPSEGMLIIRAVFILADGTKMLGCVSRPNHADYGLGALQPVILTKRGQVLFWHGVIAPGPKRLAQYYEKLERDSTRIFPIKVLSDVPLIGPPITAEIPGFLVLEDFKTGRTRTVT
jgi:hypothetical protein